jgi:hypothetical protein
VTAEANGDVPVGLRIGQDLTGVANFLAVYAGMAEPFHGLVLNVGIATVDNETLVDLPSSPAPLFGRASIHWHYRTSTGWNTLEVDDETWSLHRAGIHSVNFEAPADWTSVGFDNTCFQGTPFFWVRITWGASTSLASAHVLQISAITEV